jgi:multicomponent Na+:H+ antiporter subunit A
MDLYFLLLVLPFATALLAGMFPKWVRRFPHETGIVLTALFFTGAALLLGAVSSDALTIWSLPWAPALGVDFAFRMTAFSAWFGVIIFFLGGCVHLYACAYFAKNERLPSLLVLLGLFTTAMLGVIWSDNFYLLFLFWEGTSLLSFLLVGFHNEKTQSRQNASQALLITMAGGTALLAGFVLLHQNLGSASISTLLSSPPETLNTAAVILIMLGAMTKSAQWPFHFWLPNAMVGPTPVSAYLHSATMVKAGVFLMGTLAPVMSAHPIWTPTLVTAGLLTVASAILRGARATDLKALLACTTLAALGFLTILAGLGTPAAMLGFVIFLTAHALYKAPLFLAAGNLEKRFGTRELPQLRGAARHLPVTGIIVVISALSLIGLAPLPGFLGKEYLLKATWAYSPPLAFAVALAAAGVLALGFRIIVPLIAKGHDDKSKTPVPLGMSAATLFPALAALALVFVLALPQNFLGAAATSLGANSDAAYKFWYGWTPALMLGLGAIALSLVITWVLMKPWKAWQLFSLKLNFDSFFDALLAGLRRLATLVGGFLENGKLVTHLAIILAAVGLLSFLSLDLHLWDQLPLTWSGESLIFIGLTPLLIIATVVAAKAEKTLSLLVSLGFVGFIIALLFLWFSSPDLALTQLMAETLILFLLAGALAKAKRAETSEPKLFRFIFAVLGGILVTALILKSMTLEWDHPVSDFHLSQSKPAAFGANVVNVILVDFRALDTLGEIIVLAIAAMGANAALGAARKRAPLPETEHSALLATGARLLSYFLLPTIIWIFWRGHNAPGGGFIAALLAAGGIGMGLLASRRKFTPSFMRKMSHRLLVAGLSIAVFASLLPLITGRPYFTGLWLHLDTLHLDTLHLGTPLIFDLGVFLTVLGFCMNYLRHFHQRVL